MRSVRLRRVSVHGSYFGQNYGDILLVALYVNWVKERYGKLNINLPLCSKSNLGLIAGDSNGLLGFVRSDCLIYTGGGYFGEPAEATLKWAVRNYFRHVLIGKVFKWLNRPIAIIGVGVGPVTNKFMRKSIVSLCEYASVLAVRDVQSKDYLIEYGVRPEKILVTADAALTIQKEDIPSNIRNMVDELFPAVSDAKLVGVHLSHISSYSKNSALLLAELVDFFKSNPDLKVKLLVDGASRSGKLLEQEAAAIEMHEHLGDQAQLVPYKEHWHLIALLSRLDLIVTTKLHVGITSIAVGSHVVSFPYHMKTPRLFEQIGETDRCKPIESIVLGDVYSQLTKYIDRTDGSLLSAKFREDALKNKSLVYKFLLEL